MTATDTLTRREVEIARLLADGMSAGGIAERLFLSSGTIKWYLKQIYSKLDVHIRQELIESVRQRDFNKSPVANEAPAPHVAHSFPITPTPLIGREKTIADAVRQIVRVDVRLLTLVGPPGIGKTRLSMAVGEQVLSHLSGWR